MPVTYISKRELTVYTPVGVLRWRNIGRLYAFTTSDSSVMSVIESLPDYKDGLMYKQVNEDKPAAAAIESPMKVKNAKQAIEWLVRNKGEKRGVYTKEQIRALAEKHGVEFPNWK